jgi:adenosylcobinamide-phosphate synthase
MDSFLGLKIFAVCIVDMVLGDPRWLPHPVRLMGMVIHCCDWLIFKLCQSPLTKRAAGAVLALGLPCGCYVIVREMIRYAEHLNEPLGIVTWIVLGYTTIAARDLWDHAMCVYRALTKHGVSAARLAVSQLVGRDTEYLSEPDIVRATIESVSENTSDGIVAPLFYLALGGPALAMAYKAVNTLDSMIGYRTTRYRDIGWASAHIDDALNWIPARLTAVSISLAAALRLRRSQASWRICWRDARKHPSPNSGWPEAAMAGALGVQLGGVNEYGGVVEERARLGDFDGPLLPSLIPLALQLIGLVSFLLVVMFLIMVVVW